MEQFFSMVLVVAALWLAFAVWRRITLYAALRRLRIDYSSRREISPEELPADIRPLLEAGERPLLAMGFERVGCEEYAPLLWSGERQPRHGLYYLHQPTATFAHLTLSDGMESGAIAVTTFETWLRDGRIIGTLNRRRHLILPLPQNYLLDDGYLASVAGQWELHQRRLLALAGERIDTYAGMVQQNELQRAATLDVWLRTGLIRRTAEGVWQLTAEAAWRHARQLIRAHKRIAALPVMADEVAEEIRVEADLLAFRNYEQQLAQGQVGRLGKALLFGLSVVAGAVAFGAAFSWEIVPVLLGVLLFHEFGHALAMVATGYRNVQVMVIPLLGAVASGHKDDVGPWAKLLVLLAGPLPGLLLAMAILHGVADAPLQHPLLLQIGLMALALNLFNLLPFTPLDGGQIVETFLFARWPRLRLPFFIASSMALAALALWLESMPLFGFAVVLLLFSRRRGLSFRLAQEVGQQTRESAPRAILAVLHRLREKGGRTFAHRFQTVRALMPLVLARPLSRRESLLGLVLYVGAVVLPVYALSGLPAAQQLYHHFVDDEQVAVAVERNWDEEVARATTDEQRWSLLHEAAQWEEDENDDYEAAQRRYQQALPIAQRFAAGDLRLIDTRIGLARTSDDTAQSLQEYRAVLGATAQLEGENRVRHAEVLEAIYSLDGDASTDTRIGYLRGAIAVRESTKQSSTYWLGNDHEQLARLLYRADSPAVAEAELRQALAANNTASQALPLVWLLINHGKAGEAEEMVRSQDKNIKNGVWLEARLKEALGWALLVQGNHEEGYAQLAQAAESAVSSGGWLKYYLMLDLVKFAGDDLQLRTQWRARLKRALFEEGVGAKRLIDGMERHGGYVPWDRLRSKARIETMPLLGLPQDDPVSSCN